MPATDPCTKKQAETLAKFGYDPNSTFAEARKILDELAANNWQRPDGAESPAATAATAPARKDGQCTARQAALLTKFGYDSNVSFDEASVIIDELKANNWQRVDNDDEVPFGR